MLTSLEQKHLAVVMETFFRLQHACQQISVPTITKLSKHESVFDCGGGAGYKDRRQEVKADREREAATEL